MDELVTGTGDLGVSSAPGGISLRVLVAPRSSSTRLLGFYDGRLKVALTAPPAEGAANKALLQFLANLLGVPKSSLSIVSGSGSRKKSIFVPGLDVRQAVALLSEGT